MNAGRSGFEAIGDAMRAIPGPTDAWAEIVGHLAWPLTLLLVLRWYRRPITSATKALAVRIRTDDLSSPFLSMRRRDDLQPLDAAGGIASDVAVQERLFELISDAPTYEQVVAWVTSREEENLTVDAFLTAPECGSLRRAFLDEFESEDGHG